MNNFEAVFEVCVDQIVSGESSVEECLAQYPQFEAQLEPLLYAILRLQDEAQAVRPSPFLRSRLRSELNQAIENSSRNKRRLPFPVWRMALNVAVLIFAFVMTNTLFAQGALPGEQLYDWKLASGHPGWRPSHAPPNGSCDHQPT